MDRRSFLGILGGIFTGACLPKIVAPRPVLVPGFDSLQALALRNFDKAWDDLGRACANEMMGGWVDRGPWQ